MSNCHRILGVVYAPQGHFLPSVRAHSHVQRGNEEKIDWYWYDTFGNAKNYTGFASYFGEALNYTNVFIASPIIVASVVQPYDYVLTLERN